MYAQVEKPKENKIRTFANAVAQKNSDKKQGFGFADNRPEADYKIQQTCAQLFDTNNKVSNVIQRADNYFPDSENEPHIHEHNGGITYTDVGHNHRDLQVGDQIRHNVIQEVMQTLQGYHTDRANQIIAWIVNRFGVQAPNEEEEDEEVPIDPDIAPEWRDAEQEDHNPEGHAPRAFQFQGGRGDGIGFDR